MKLKKLIFSLFVLILPVAKIFPQEWQLTKNQDGIKIYIRERSDGNVEFKGFTTINATPSMILKVIKDGRNYPEWIDKVSDAEMIETGKNYFVVWYRISMPIGFDDRDIVLRNEIVKQKNGAIKINLVSQSGKVAPKPGIVRIENAQGYWELVPKGRQTLVKYRFFADIGTGLPAWIVKLFVDQAPFNTLKNLKSMFNQ